jgi:hypothetical protein
VQTGLKTFTLHSAGKTHHIPWNIPDSLCKKQAARKHRELAAKQQTNAVCVLGKELAIGGKSQIVKIKGRRRETEEHLEYS